MSSMIRNLSSVIRESRPVSSIRRETSNAFNPRYWASQGSFPSFSPLKHAFIVVFCVALCGGYLFWWIYPSIQIANRNAVQKQWNHQTCELQSQVCELECRWDFVGEICWSADATNLQWHRKVMGGGFPSICGEGDPLPRVKERCGQNITSNRKTS